MGAERVVPKDPERIYELLMAGAGTIVQVEAAERLVFQVEPLREWLISGGFMRLHQELDSPYVATHFNEAIERLRELSRDGEQYARFGPGKSERAVLFIAASFSGGVEIGTLRHFLPDLRVEHVKLAAEALMYAAGCMDGAADPVANEPLGPGSGPNAIAYDERF